MSWTTRETEWMCEPCVNTHDRDAEIVVHSQDTPETVWCPFCGDAMTCEREEWVDV